MVINTKGFKRYGKEIRGAELVDNVLRVPNGFLGKKLLALWLHPNYILLEDFLVRNAKDKDATAMDVDEVWKLQFHLVGTAGIGKTYFGHYWFFKQAKAGKRVIWRTKTGVFICYDFALEDPFVQAFFQYDVPEHWMEEIETIWLVVDGACKGVEHDGFVLQCVSPARGGYHEYAKDLGVLCHLEAWTLDELMECRDALKLGFTDDELEERFYYCGGMPRLVLDKTKTSSSLKGSMTMALPSWEAVIRHAASGADKDEGISDHLIHYQLKRELTPNALPSDCVLDYELKFASAYVEDLVHDEYQRQGHDKVKAFIGFCQKMPEAHALLEKFFERHVHSNLRNGGGEFSVKDLETPGNPLSVLELKPSSTKRIRRWQVAKVPNLPSQDEKMRLLVEAQMSTYDQDTPRKLLDSNL